MAKINPSNYKIKYSDTFFFDTNIWILLFGTIANTQKKEQKLYSNLFEEILIKEKSIYITTLVISEFTNVLLRKDYKEWIHQNSPVNYDYKKDFVGTDYYKNSITTIKILINKIINLPNIIKVSDSLNSLDFESILNSFEKIDFNDSVFIELCKKNNYIIVSNDKDMLIASDDLNIISAY